MMFSATNVHSQFMLRESQLGFLASLSNQLYCSVRNALTTTFRNTSSTTASASTKIHKGADEVTCKWVEELGFDQLAAVIDRITLERLNPLLGLLSLQEENSSLKRLHRISGQELSYVSKNSFFENKYGFHENELLENKFSARPSFRLLKNVPSSQSCCWNQRRGFKTKRSSSAVGFGTKRETHEADDSHTVIGKLRESMHMGRVSSGIGSKNHKLTSMVSDHHALPEVQDKIKIAFAEGYMAHNKTGAEKSAVWPKRIAKFITYALIIWLAVQLFQGYRALGGNVKLGVLSGQKYEIDAEEISVTFDDVKGVEEAKQELQDIVEFLSDPEKFRALGAKLPKGVLLVGLPGTGKTLLARAVAGEAGVPFFHASGSEFDEIFVGTGAKRVRQLFEAAKAKAPCVVFIDEIDTVGAKRSSSQIHPYANQTINQLLSEMDGFQQNEGVIVLGATNRRDNLDPALLRPGRFDVEVRVAPPDLKGRKEILEYYLSKIKMERGLDVDRLARGTIGCTGADLENIVNQAALKAAMDGALEVTLKHLEFSRDKVFMGPANKSKIPDEDTNTNTAYHEAGHTLVAYFTKDATALHKVTIVPRGQTLGHTFFVPDKEIYDRTKSQLLASMDVAMGGRVAEEITFGLEKVTTGASDDFKQATAIATAMVKHFGMSEKVGVRVFGDSEFDGGQAFIRMNELSPSTSELVDNEIKRLLQESYERARTILQAHKTEHKAIAQALLTYETLDAEEVKALIEGRKPKKTLEVL